MKVSTTKSKNAESFYITKSYINSEGKSTSKIIRKLGTLAELSKRLETDRAGVMAWAKEQAKIETQNYKKEEETKELCKNKCYIFLNNQCCITEFLKSKRMNYFCIVPKIENRNFRAYVVRLL